MNENDNTIIEATQEQAKTGESAYFNDYATTDLL